LNAVSRKPDLTDQNVGERIRARRRQLRLSQTKLGDAIGVSFQQIQKYEKGTNRISASKLNQIGRVLGVAPGYFYASEDDHSGLSEKEQQALLDNREGIVRLAAAFEQITDEDVRRNLVELAEQLARKKKQK
jgi:transcriptional regulator with XRE-family HTH domain